MDGLFLESLQAKLGRGGRFGNRRDALTGRGGVAHGRRGR
jgi:hypothetical protein